MASEPSGPTHRRQLGSELRRLRIAAGLKIEHVATELNCSHSRVSRIETAKGRVAITPDDVRTMCALYGVTDAAQIRMLLDMLTNSQSRGWWETYKGVLPSGLENLVGLEADARTERAWEPLIVHGLLQTTDYARAVLRSWPSNRPHEIDDLVTVRIGRQQVLKGDLELWAIIDEGVLRRPIGGSDVMRGQLEHLVVMSEEPNVTIQVLPTARGGHPGLGGAFSLLEFESDDPIVYVDSPAGNLYLTRREDERFFTSTFDLLRAMALAPDESIALIQRAAEEILR